MFSPVPYRHVVIRTSLSPEKASSMVSSAVGSRRGRKTGIDWFWPDPSSFEGEVFDDRFKIKRSYSAWSRQIRPIVYGRLNSISRRTDVDIRITVGPITWCILIVFVIKWIVDIVSSLECLITTGALDQRLGFTMLVGLVFYAFVTVAFNTQADAAEDFIEGVFHRFRRDRTPDFGMIER